MSDKKLNIEEISALLRKLHQGKLTSKERWRLERASLDDPFLSDALEGYYDNDGDHESAITQLDKRLQEKYTDQKPKRRILPLRWVGMAASLAVLLVASFWLFNSIDDSSESTTMASSSTHENERADATHKSLEILSQNQAADTQKAPTSPQDKTPVKTTSPSAKSDLPDAQPQRTTAKKSKSTSSPTVKTRREDIAVQKIEKPIDNDLPNDVFESRKSGVEEEMVVVADAAPQSDIEEKVAVVTATKEKRKATTGHYNKPETEPLLIEESMLNAADISERDVVTTKTTNVATLKSQLILLDEKGRALPGVHILDRNNNSLGNSDSNGMFLVPKEQPYVIAAFAGYDSLTVASAPMLSMEMQNTAELLGQPHKRLVDQMDDAELIRYYTNELNSLFAKEWPLCEAPDRSVGYFSTTSIHLVIENSGRLAEPHYFREVDPNCKRKITEVLESAVESQLFASGRGISFAFRINL